MKTQSDLEPKPTLHQGFIRTNIERISAIVCNEFEISNEQLYHKSRERYINVYPRQVLFYLLHEELGLPCSQISHHIKPHYSLESIKYAVRTIRDLPERDRVLRPIISNIQKRIRE